MEPEPESSLDLEDLIVAAVRRLMRAIDLHSRRLVDDFGLTGPQLATLRELDRTGPIAASRLARGVHLSNATITGIVTRLEKRGFVSRRRGEEDRRTVLVGITDAGKDALSRAPSLLQDRFRRELSSLATWEQLMMLANLQRIASMMDAEQLAAAPHLVSDADALDPPTPEEPEIAPTDTDPARN